MLRMSSAMNATSSASGTVTATISPERIVREEHEHDHDEHDAGTRLCSTVCVVEGNEIASVVEGTTFTSFGSM